LRGGCDVIMFLSNLSFRPQDQYTLQLWEVKDVRHGGQACEIWNRVDRQRGRYPTRQYYETTQ
jgi:hypothetical protein